MLKNTSEYRLALAGVAMRRPCREGAARTSPGEEIRSQPSPSLNAATFLPCFCCANGCVMVVGILFIAMLAGGFAALVSVVAGGSLLVCLLAYMGVGTVTMFLFTMIVFLQEHRKRAGPSQGQWAQEALR